MMFLMIQIELKNIQIDLKIIDGLIYSTRQYSFLMILIFTKNQN